MNQMFYMEKSRVSGKVCHQETDPKMANDETRANQSPQMNAEKEAT